MDEIERLGSIIQGTTRHRVAYKWFGDSLPYRWELVSRLEPQRYIGTIQLTAVDILSLHAKTDTDRAAYLQERFGHTLSP
jgi:hypothetical protein